jgi:hypothetical protein
MPSTIGVRLGPLRKAGNRIRVIAQSIPAADGNI